MHLNEEIYGNIGITFSDVLTNLYTMLYHILSGSRRVQLSMRKPELYTVSDAITDPPRPFCAMTLTARRIDEGRWRSRKLDVPTSILMAASASSATRSNTEMLVTQLYRPEKMKCIIKRITIKIGLSVRICHHSFNNKFEVSIFNHEIDVNKKLIRMQPAYRSMQNQK